MLNFLQSNRSKKLAIIILAIMVVFVLRLFYLQVVKHEYYAALASQEQMRQWVLPAVRGEIYAMNRGQPVKLVMNETVYTVWVDPKVVEDQDGIVETLERVAGGNLRKNYRELLNKTDTRYQILATDVTYRQAEMIKSENLYGLGFERGERRVYPEGQLASQVLGFVNREHVGQYGVEGAFNEQLSGENGLLKTIADVRDVPLTIGDANVNMPARDGENVVLTIDRGVQALTEKALQNAVDKTGAKYASALVMNPQNGQVLAMANLPTYNPEQLERVNDVALFNNNIISEPYEAGSVIKAFTVATGIDTGTITPNSTFYNTDSVVVDGERISNLTKGQTGNVTMQHALDWSLNTGMVEIAERMGDGSYISNDARQTMYRYFFDKFKLGQNTGISLAGERPGTIIKPGTVQGNAVRYATMTFGQGMDVTMMQAAAGFSSIVTDGKYRSPTVEAGRMVNGKYQPADELPVHQAIKPETADQTRQMLHKARQAFYASSDSRGFYTGGKTGTSETIVDGSYRNRQTIGTYLGFGGEVDEMPSYVIMVKLSGPGMTLEGGRHAAPVFTEISNGMLRYLKLQPKE